VRRRTFHVAHGAGRINVTPMIDVVMVLIVFFLLVGKLAAERYAPVDLPASRAGAPPDRGDALVINVVPAPGGTSLVIDGVELSVESVESVVRRTRAEHPQRPVRVRADRSLAYGAVRPVIEACRRAGVSSVALATEGD